MKKFLTTTILVFLLMGLVLPRLSMAQPETPQDICTIKNDTVKNISDCNTDLDTATNGHQQKGICCVVDAIYTITDWVFYVIFILSVVMIVIGGGIYITAAGDPAKTEHGRGIIKYSIIGLIIALLAKMFPYAVKSLTGL